MMCSAARFIVLALLVLCALSAPVAAQSIYDTSADFSYAENPNGVWSYNVGASPLPFAQVGWGGVPGETFWATTAAGTIPPAVGRAVTDKTPAADWLPGDVLIHATNPGGSGFGNITWTSPSAGRIDIAGKAWDAAHSPGRDDAWSLSLNGNVLASRPGIVGVQRGDAAADFANNLQPLMSLEDLVVQPGDLLKFEVQNIFGCCGHFTGMELTVSLVPEPSILLTGTLILFSFLASARWRSLMRWQR